MSSQSGPVPGHQGAKMAKDEPVTRCTRTLAFRSDELLRSKEITLGVYNLEVIEHGKKPRVYLENVPASDVVRIAKEWCEYRGIEYADD